LRPGAAAFARVLIALAVLVALGSASCHRAGAKDGAHSIVLATTTSTRDSGLLDELVPRFRAETGVDVKVVAVGTGQALEIGRRGDADVLLVHSAKAEEQFMAEGRGLSRQRVMYNDFVIAGPKTDPAHVTGKGAREAFVTIASAQAVFVSRGDSSGTHVAEQELWRTAGVSPHGDWYKSAGQGMAEVLRMAQQLDGYVLSDRATFLAQRKQLDLVVLVEKDPSLFNPYGVIVVKTSRDEKTRADARRFADFLLAPATQKAIAAHGVARDGEPSFFVY
jgi:tungstate transport system substrate-binding protein